MNLLWKLGTIAVGGIWNLGCSPDNMAAGKCSACRVIRTRCLDDCLFAAIFPPGSDEAVGQFTLIYNVHGTHIAKRLINAGSTLEEKQMIAASLVREAAERISDPIHGISGVNMNLEAQNCALKNEKEGLYARVHELES